MKIGGRGQQLIEIENDSPSIADLTQILDSQALTVLENLQTRRHLAGDDLAFLVQGFYQDFLT